MFVGAVSWRDRSTAEHVRLPTALSRLRPPLYLGDPGCSTKLGRASEHIACE